MENKFISNNNRSGASGVSKALATILAIGLILVGCGGTSSDEKKVDINALSTELLAVDTEMPEMTTVTSDSEQAETNFSVLADFDYSLVDEYTYSYSASGGPEELAIIHLKKSTDVADLMRAIDEHIESRKSTFTQYSPEQAGMLDDAILTYEGSYVLYVVAEKGGSMQEKFKESI